LLCTVVLCLLPVVSLEIIMALGWHGAGKRAGVREPYSYLW